MDRKLAERLLTILDEFASKHDLVYDPDEFDAESLIGAFNAGEELPCVNSMPFEGYEVLWINYDGKLEYFSGPSLRHKIADVESFDPNKVIIP